MKIVLLTCDEFPGILTPDIPSYEWMFEGLFLRADRRCRFDVYHTMEGEVPQDLNTEDLYLITGSTSDSFSDEPWIAGLRKWIKRAYKAGCKLAGICFGHQIIAEALGGKTRRSDKGWGIGLRKSTIVDNEFIYIITGKDGAESPSTFTLLYDHHDQVKRLPKGATLISTSDFCPNESYRIGRQVLCFQGHPEFTNSFIRHWITDCAPDEPETVKAAALRSMDSMENQGAMVASWILKFF